MIFEPTLALRRRDRQRVRAFIAGRGETAQWKGV
jgi:hypothetical protein